MERPAILFGYHFPKTGGTSFSFNFSQAIGEDKILREGPEARRRTFFAGRPQLEEMFGAEWDAVRLVYGHGVTGRILPMLPAVKVELVFVARDPMSLFASRIKHRLLMQARSGQDPGDVEEFKSDYRPNDMTRSLLRVYGNFLDVPETESEDSLRQNLKCVKHLLCTERLTAQLMSLNASLGLPPPQPESRRVSQDHSQIRPDDEAAFKRDNRLDYLLYEMALASGTAESKWFDPRIWEAKSAITRAATQNAISLEEGIATTITSLAADNALEAALLQMQIEEPGRRRNRALYLQAVEAAQTHYAEEVRKPLRRKRNDLNVMRVLKRNGDYSTLWQRAQAYIDEHGSDAHGLRFWKFAKRELTRGRKGGVKKRSRQRTPMGEQANERTGNKAQT